MNVTRIVRPKQLPNIIGVSLPTVWRMVRRGEFPSPMRLSPQAVGWDIQDVEAWIGARRSVGGVTN